MLEKFGFEISWPKYRISRRYTHYCQDFGIHPRFYRPIKVDTIKLRLFNEFQKQGGTQYDTADPLVGKAREMEGNFKYLGHTEKDKVFEMAPYILKAGMPSFFEKKVYSKGLGFLPSMLGGLGIPSRTNSWTHSMHILAANTVLRRTEPDLMPEGRKFIRIWERSMEMMTQVHNFATIQGLDPMSTKEKFQELQEAMSISNSSEAGPPSNKRVKRQMLKTCIDITKPQALLGNKMAIYAAVYRGESDIATVDHKKRAGPVLRELLQRANSLRRHLRPIVYTIDPSVGAGIWVEREMIHASLQVSFYVPSTDIKLDFFEGIAGSYDPGISAEVLTY
jgi:hypothetical protein